MPSPLHFSEERDLLLALAQPVGQRSRPEFLAAVAKSSRPCGQARRPRRRAHDSEEILHPARIAQRVAALPQRLKGEVQHYGRGRDLSVSSVLAFFASASVGVKNLPSTKARRRGRDAVGC
jgi:hypothetical protein